MNDTTTASPPNTPHRRRKSRAGLILGLAVIVAAGGWYGWNKYRANADKEGEYIMAAVTTGDIEDLVTSTGTLQPRDYVDVGAQVSGQIEKLYVEVGDVVELKQDLASIDATTAIAKVDSLRAQLLSAETNLETQKANLEKAQRDYQRQVNLLAADATTKETVLNSETTLKNAERQIISSKASIEQQKANMRIEERNLGYTKIVAPIAGTVMKISVKEGQTVNASQNVPNVMQIAKLTTMTVQSEVSEADVAKLYKGIPVYFTTLGGNSRRWYGTLKRIEPTPKVQNSVVLYNALFDVENEGGSLMPSMTAQVYFVSAEAKQVLMVPMAALQQGQQIVRELAAKEREKNAAKPAVPGAPATANAGAAPAAAAPADGAAGPANAPGSRSGNGQSDRGGPPGGGGFGGQRPGANGGNGQRQGGGGFDFQNLTPEQREQMATRMRGQGGGGFNGPRPGGGGNFNASAGAPGGAARPTQQRRGTVMVSKTDGTLEARQVVVGVTNRVHGQVLSGLKEGEEVVVGKRQEEAAAATPSTQNPRNQNQPGGPGGLPGGGFPGGGGGGPGGGGGGGRPF